MTDTEHGTEVLARIRDKLKPMINNHTVPEVIITCVDVLNDYKRNGVITKFIYERDDLVLKLHMTIPAINSNNTINATLEFVTEDVNSAYERAMKLL